MPNGATFKPEDYPELDKYLEYLDFLRGTANVNMHGAGPYLAAEFGLPPTSALEVLMYWMSTYAQRHPEAS